MLNTTMLSSGIYTDISMGDTIVSTRKAATSARRALTEGYAWEPQRTSSHNTRARKTQVSESFHTAWLTDIMEHTAKKNIVVHDPFMGIGTLACAAVRAKVPQSGLREHWQTPTLAEVIIMHGIFYHQTSWLSFQPIVRLRASGSLILIKWLQQPVGVTPPLQL